jgi:hypothetical protein
VKLIALGLNICFGLYLHVIKPVQTYAKGVRMGRQLKAMRNAGLLLVLFVGGIAPLHAQTTEHFQARKEAQLRRLAQIEAHLTPQYQNGPNRWVWKDKSKDCYGDGCIVSVFYLGHGRYQATWWDASIIEFDAPEPKASIIGSVRSDGDDVLVQKWTLDSKNDGITGVASIDKAFLYVWNNCGKLMILFGLLAVCYLLAGKLERSNQCYGDVLREEAAERWEEENGDEMHNPFDSPEGMQPASQYVPVRTKQ